MPRRLRMLWGCLGNCLPLLLVYPLVSGSPWLCLPALLLCLKVTSHLIAKKMHRRQACSCPPVTKLVFISPSYCACSLTGDCSKPEGVTSELRWSCASTPGAPRASGFQFLQELLKPAFPGNNLTSSFPLLIFCNGVTEYERFLLFIFNLETHF